MKTINGKEEKEVKRPVIEMITKEDYEKIIKGMMPYANIHFLDYDEVYSEFDYSPYTGYCFNGEPITSIGIVTPKSNLYPKDNTDCYDFETKEDFNYYILSTETEALIKSPLICEKPYGMSEIKHHFFIKNKKVQDLDIDEDTDERVTATILTDDFLFEFSSDEDVPPSIEYSVPLAEAAADFTKVMEEYEDAFCMKFEDNYGKIGDYCMGYLDRVFDEVRLVVYNKIHYLKDIAL